jgi:hypothetical protein
VSGVARPDTDLRYTAAALDVLRCHLTGEQSGPVAEAAERRDRLRATLTGPPSLERIGDRFGLSGFERDILLMCAGVEFDIGFAHACAAAQGDPDRTYATFALALDHLPEADWAALSPAGPLRRRQLVTLRHPEVPTTSALLIAERALHALRGVHYVDPDIEPYTEPIPPAAGLSEALAQAAEAVAGHLGGDTLGGSRLLLYGRPRGDLRAVVAAACGRTDRPVLALAGAAVPEDAAGRDHLARLCERATRFDGTCWLLDLDLPDRARSQALELVRRIAAPVILIAREPVAGLDADTVPLAVRRATAPELRRVWQAALGPAASPLAGRIDHVAGRFDLGADAIRVVAAEVRALPATDAEALETRLWAACRHRARPDLAGLAQRIEPRADWADVVLPTAQQHTLRQIAAHVRHRLVVLDDWGFARRTGRGLGTAAMFAGPSGTGKTLAAEVVAGALRLDLYRVDLSRTVSKYIGETEKNLARIFDAAESGGGVLLFDEADALFGKRGEVKDGRDRYANIEVGYLLQRIEAFRGLAVLTTNLPDTVDPAFLRRLRFVVRFPFPDAAARREIWERAFPPGAPTDGLDLDALARLTVPGGTIQSIALSAAFLAADAGEPIRMSHVLAAARTEYARLDRPLTTAELAEPAGNGRAGSGVAVSPS